MSKKQGAAEKPKEKNRAFRTGFLVMLIAAALTAVYIRTNPKWKAAELTIEPAGRYYEVQSLVPEGKTLETRIIPPDGFERVPVKEGSFGEYMRNYPLLPDDIKIPVYDGTTISSTDVAAVFDISLGTEGYQQCADSVIRLYSDYFYEKGEFDKISFKFSNGDECSYNDWRKGMRMLAFADFSCRIPFGLPDKSEQQYRNYLKQVMRYAGTLSLQKESEVISADELRIGDIICNDTHVVMIADEAVNENDEKCYLIGQSFIPAVCFHILTHTEENVTSPWYTSEQLEKDSFVIGSFIFEKNDIRRWKDGF
ncbi:MAG: DUF4846 domain-containing protein [Ruminococcus sp.]|uniref:DUF4846 domain-containing protein n=1 Tax=Ruminococcus sp. TaxID=41978 RepID=UPI0025E7C5C3|nr:DUF4846 domain-containing protein [Ruminococcus sp.]MBR5682604.1 DUF4846 domain-containing protein [Ruminococcus sp.]